jgi:RNA 3'-terminal phosphate cyclase (ATP)
MHLLTKKLFSINYAFFELTKLNKKTKTLRKLHFTRVSMATNDYSPVEIDGSYLEGGGQILRISTALSVLLKKTIHVTDIRKGRKDGGLKAQHLTGIVLLEQISKAKLTGGEIKSTEITFKPGNLTPGSYLADTKTAGSITLLLQNTVPVLIFGSEASELHLRGGTNVSFSPQIEEFQEIFMPIVNRHFGIELECRVLRKGYYPQGGGEVYLKAIPVKNKLRALVLEDFGELKSIYGRAYVAGTIPEKIADRMAVAAKNELKQAFENVQINIESVREPDRLRFGNGTGLIIFAETTTGCLLSGSALGKRGVSSEEVAKEATQALIKDLREMNCLDEHMQDQVIIFMALAEGESRLKCGALTDHTKTAIHYSELITGAKFQVIENGPNSSTIICQGIAFSRSK